MLFLIVFLSCKEEEKTYPSSAPANCSAWFCAEDFTEGTVTPSEPDSSDSEDTGAFDTANPNDTAQVTDTFGNPIDGNGGNGDGNGGGGAGEEDSGFHKESDECGCADPNAGLSVLLFTSIFGLWRRERER